MPNNPATHRIISTRVPISIYMETLTEASESNVSMSDYLLILITKGKKLKEAAKIYDKEEWEMTKEHYKNMAKEIMELKKKYESCMTEGKKIFAENKILRKDIEDKDKLLSGLRIEIKYLRENQKDKS